MDSAHISRLKMHRSRVVDGRSNSMFEKRALGRVSVRRSKHVLVENRQAIGSPVRARNAGIFQGAVVGVGDSASTQIVGVQAPELYAQDRRLNFIETTVDPGLI